MAEEMAQEPCGDSSIDPDVQAFMDLHCMPMYAWPRGLKKPVTIVHVVDELL